MLSRVIELCCVVIVLLAGLLVAGGSAFGQETSSGRCGGPFAGEGVLHSNGLDRHYRVHVPPRISGHDLPLIIALHGRGSTGAALERESGLSGIHAIVAYPQALPGVDGQAAWQGAPYSSSVDDVAFVASLIDHLDRLWCVDDARVHVVGLSNGGGLAAMLGCRLADRLAGYATVAGAFYPEAGGCSPARPVLAVNLHGANDQVVPYEGNPAKGQPAVQGWLRQRAALNGCGDRMREWRQYGVEAQRWASCARGAAVTHYRVVDGGHEWPKHINTAGLIWASLARAGAAV